ncbi:hypothetical protein QJS83_05070 [Bdellovibrio sp. 22V]|uniref:hypothetical protein n=1 Tax=Bdellovibrio TaxID=958 RepID=UPI002543DABE|nr:hypothetical protein [Bdellovibrio sp. 22V]WII73238.1 hypothetical protein QJS83_05070 [Bdellovibrio sp. 22V]
MLQKISFIFSFLASLYLPTAFAAPLGTIPTIQEQNLQMLFNFRSDLWASPYTYKESPLRIIGGDIRVPLLKSESWSASANVFLEGLNLGRTQFSLGGEDVFIANTLQDEGVGFGVRKDFESGSTLSVFAAYATASDDPWADLRNNYFNGTVSYRTAPGGDYYWIFAVNQSNNRGIYNGTPFPFIGVIRDVNPEFKASFGFPFVVLQWGTGENWIKSFSMTPFGTQIGAAKDLAHGFAFDARAALTVRSYMLDERTEDSSRLYYQEIFVEGAFKKFVTPETGVSFALGAAVDRRLYESERIYHPNSKVTTIDSDFYGRLGVEFRL